MLTALKRFQHISKDMPDHCLPDKTWTFRQALSKKDITFFKPLLRQHPDFMLEYRTLRVGLNQLNTPEEKDSKLMTDKLVAALKFAELQEKIYQYIHVPREIARFKREQAVYRKELMQRGYTFSDEDSSEEELLDESCCSITQIIRDGHYVLDQLRWLLFRSKHVLEACALFSLGASSINQSVTNYPFSNMPLLGCIGFLFFVPRLFANLYLMFKHLVPGWWMSDEERSVALGDRFAVQWQRRGMEIANDAPALIITILSCFVWVHTLAFLNFYFVIGFYAYDMLIHQKKYTIESDRLEDLRDAYASSTPGELALIEQQIDLEKNHHKLNQVHTALICFCFLLFAPFTGTIAPTIGAAGMVFTTIAVLCLRAYMVKTSPSIDFTPLSAKDPELTTDIDNTAFQLSTQ